MEQKSDKAEKAFYPGLRLFQMLKWVKTTSHLPAFATNSSVSDELCACDMVNKRTPIILLTLEITIK